jgi:uncharacterized protein (DUF486 family)
MRAKCFRTSAENTAPRNRQSRLFLQHRHHIAPMMRYILPILLLFISNVFMILAWYGHLKIKEWRWFEQAGLFTFILLSWGLAFFEYCFQVPANKLGFRGNGGPYTLLQLKVIQEVVTLLVFLGFSWLFFKEEGFRMNHAIGLFFLVLAVYFIFRK